jgi:hypothetical protein
MSPSRGIKSTSRSGQAAISPALCIHSASDRLSASPKVWPNASGASLSARSRRFLYISPSSGRSGRTSMTSLLPFWITLLAAAKTGAPRLNHRGAARWLQLLIAPLPIHCTYSNANERVRTSRRLPRLLRWVGAARRAPPRCGNEIAAASPCPTFPGPEVTSMSKRTMTHKGPALCKVPPWRVFPSNRLNVMPITIMLYRTLSVGGLLNDYL